MLTKFAKTVVMMAAALLAAGCVSTVPLASPPPPQVSYQPLNKTNYTVAVGPINDARTGLNPRYMFDADMVADYGGLFPKSFYATQPVVNVIHNNFISALAASHYPVVTSNADYTLTGHLLHISTDITPGSMYHNILHTTMQMDLELINNRNNAVVWSQHFTGNSAIEPGKVSADDDAQAAFNGAMNDINTQLVNSPTFIQALQHQKVYRKKCKGVKHCKLIF